MIEGCIDGLVRARIILSYYENNSLLCTGEGIPDNVMRLTREEARLARVRSCSMTPLLWATAEPPAASRG